MVQLTAKQKIIVHICYRDVFRAPVSKKKLMTWLGLEQNNEEQKKLDFILNELKEEGLIIENEGFLAVAGKEENIRQQSRKTALTRQILKKGSVGLKVLSIIPFIKFIGVSGSVAAENPTEEYGDNFIDLDLFVVTAQNSLWCFLLAERLFTNAIRFLKGKHFYCLNYITDESFIEIFNKNFYTATELVNLKPILDKGVYNKLLSTNCWCNRYYDLGTVSNGSSIRTPSIGSYILLPFNYLLFFVFGILRSIKRFDLIGIRDLKLKFDPTKRSNLRRQSNPNGGYQERIKERFEELFKNNFASYWSEEIVEELFPNEGSFMYSPTSNSNDFEINQLFRKYSIKADAKNSI